MMKKLVLFIFILCCTVVGWGQASQYMQPSMSICRAPMGNGVPLCTLTNIQYQVCSPAGSYGSTPCNSNKATLYTDLTVGTQAPNPFPPDAAANITFYTGAPGWYTVQFLSGSSVFGQMT